MKKGFNAVTQVYDTQNLTLISICYIITELYCNRSDPSSLRIAYRSSHVRFNPDNNGNNAMRIIPETATAADASASSGVISGTYSAKVAAIKTAILRIVSAKT